MSRYVRAVLSTAIVAGGFGSTGCTGPSLGDKYNSCVDPCNLARYNAAARSEVLDPFRKQVNNGNVMNHTIYNYYFEVASDRLTPAGFEKLNSIVRERPAPEGRVYIQTARDIAVKPAADDVPGNVDNIAELRNDLDARRAAAIQKYLAASPNFTGVAFNVFVHDPAVPFIDSNFAGNSYRAQSFGYRGGIGIAGGTQVTSTGAGGQGGLGGGGTGAGGQTGAGAPGAGAGGGVGR